MVKVVQYNVATKIKGSFVQSVWANKPAHIFPCLNCNNIYERSGLTCVDCGYFITGHYNWNVKDYTIQPPDSSMGMATSKNTTNKISIFVSVLSMLCGIFSRYGRKFM